MLGFATREVKRLAGRLWVCVLTLSVGLSSPPALSITLDECSDVAAEMRQGSLPVQNPETIGRRLNKFSFGDILDREELKTNTGLQMFLKKKLFTDNVRPAIKLLYEEWKKAEEKKNGGDRLSKWSALSLLEDPLDKELKQCKISADQKYRKTVFGSRVANVLLPSTRDTTDFFTSFGTGKFTTNFDKNFTSDEGGAFSARHEGDFQSAITKVLTALQTWKQSDNTDDALERLSATKQAIYALAPMAYQPWPDGESAWEISLARLHEAVYFASIKPKDGTVDVERKLDMICGGDPQATNLLRGSQYVNEAAVWVGSAEARLTKRIGNGLVMLSDGKLAELKVYGEDQLNDAIRLGNFAEARRWRTVIAENQLRSLIGEDLNLTPAVTEEYDWLHCEDVLEKDACLLNSQRGKGFDKALKQVKKQDQPLGCMGLDPNYVQNCQQSAEKALQQELELCEQRRVRDIADRGPPQLNLFDTPSPSHTMRLCVQQHCANRRPWSPEIVPTFPRPEVFRPRSPENNSVALSHELRKIIENELNESPYAPFEITGRQRPLNDSTEHATRAALDIRSKDLQTQSEREARAADISRRTGGVTRVIKEEPVFKEVVDVETGATTEIKVREKHFFENGKDHGKEYDAIPVRADFGSHIHLSVKPTALKRANELWLRGELNCATFGLPNCR